MRFKGKQLLAELSLRCTGNCARTHAAARGGRPRGAPLAAAWVRAEIHDPNSANNSRAIFVLKVRLAHLALRVTLVNN